ncbi:putative phage tail protein [Paenibacillus sp. sgz500958]|uniref:putative phage tail protein n=1 Tax=Paenibacillus sp. sgz500958 TaxID=3242475 RepID=UPI0036D21171
MNAERLARYLPEYYSGVLEMEKLLGAEEPELALLESRVLDLLNQAYPASATWALERYEKELQIAVDRSKPVDQRRSVILSKMRGYGKVSGAMIHNVVQAFDEGTIEVGVSHAEYKIIITFVDTLGIPANLDDVKRALEEIKPAHMTLAYEFRFLLLNEIHGVMTLKQLEHIPLSKFAGGEGFGH